MSPTRSMVTWSQVLNPSDGYHNFIVWTVAETDIAVLCACLPTLRPVLEPPLKVLPARISWPRRARGQDDWWEEGLTSNVRPLEKFKVEELRPLSMYSMSTVRGLVTDSERDCLLTVV